jgi:hypothetical protein
MIAFSNMSQVIYARVPEILKESTEEFAGDQGLTLTSAIVSLLQTGLETVANDRSIAKLESRLAQSENRRAELEAELRVATNELAGLRSFIVRARQIHVGKCPTSTCQEEITGFDLLSGQCHKCGGSLLGLLAPPSSNSLEQREIGMLVGALGAILVGAVILGSKGT